MALNKMMLIGRLTADPEPRSNFNGEKYVFFSLAINEYFLDKNNEKQQKTTFINAQIWNKPAENFIQVASKGALLFLEGKFIIRRVEEKEYCGIKVAKFIVLSAKKQETLITAEDLMPGFLASQEAKAKKLAEEEEDDELPF